MYQIIEMSECCPDRRCRQNDPKQNILQLHLKTLPSVMVHTSQIPNAIGIWLPPFCILSTSNPKALDISSRIISIHRNVWPLLPSRLTCPLSRELAKKSGFILLKRLSELAGFIRRLL